MYSWATKSAFNRSQILFFVAENFQLFHKQLVHQLCTDCGWDTERATAEVNGAVDAFKVWASACLNSAHSGNVLVSVIVLFIDRCIFLPFTKK